jgi:hypothetical protein
MKIIKFIGLFFLFVSSLFGNVKLYLPSNTIVKNEAFNFILEAYGNDITFPNISLIDGQTVQEISSSTSTNVTNGKIAKKIKKTYSFYPMKDFILPSFEIQIDGKSYKTNEEKISIQKALKTQSLLFDFDIKTNNDNLYLGENFILTMVFKYKKNLDILDLSFDKPSFEDFWYKQIDNTKKYEEGDFNVFEIKFLMFALKAGIQKIEPIGINAQIMDDNSYSVFSSTKNKKIYSNELNFNIKELPVNINLIGNFEINSSVDKQIVKKGEAISFKLNIIGSGNIDDISDIKLPIDDVTIYENKALVKTQILNNEYKGEWEKVYSIIANKSFTIPSIKIDYFDKKLSKIVSKKSASFNIEVVGEDIKKEVVLQKAEEKILPMEKQKEIIKIIDKTSTLDRVIFFFLGVAFSLLIISLYFYVITSRRKKQEDKPLLKKVKESKTKDELLKILAVYLKIDTKLDVLIFELEKTQDIKFLKKEIIKILKELNI